MIILFIYIYNFSFKMSKHNEILEVFLIRTVTIYSRFIYFSHKIMFLK